MKTLFQNLGATDKETDVFLKMLRLGAQPVSVIAKHAGLPRSSMYVILERLKKLQLIEEFKHNGITYVKCIPVKELENILKTRERAIHHTFELLKENLPKLESLENKLSITPTVKFYEGKKAVMKMYEDVMREKEFYASFNPAVVQKVMPEYCYKVGEILEKNSRRAKELVIDSGEAHRYKKRFHSELHQIKILPANTDFSADIIIGSTKIYMISYGEREVSGTEIENPSITGAMRIIFLELWKRLQ